MRGRSTVATIKLDRRWILVIICLALIIFSGITVILIRYNPASPIEIIILEEQEVTGQIYIGGAVNQPGLFPFTGQDNIEDLLQAAGGVNDNATLSHISLYVPEALEKETPQKVNINRADAWLLDALPGIGESRANSIIDYRQKNGSFQITYEITEVPGIGTAIYEQIKDLITVSD